MLKVKFLPVLYTCLAVLEMSVLLTLPRPLGREQSARLKFSLEIVLISLEVEVVILGIGMMFSATF